MSFSVLNNWRVYGASSGVSLSTPSFPRFPLHCPHPRAVWTHIDPIMSALSLTVDPRPPRPPHPLSLSPPPVFPPSPIATNIHANPWRETSRDGGATGEGAGGAGEESAPLPVKTQGAAVGCDRGGAKEDC